MPSYHSKVGENPEVPFRECCASAIMPIKTAVRGPAPSCPVGTDDILDETMAFFRANVLFRNFDVRDGPDRTLIYLTLYLQQCLVKCEKFDDKAGAQRELFVMAQKPFAIPGEPAWPLASIFSPPKNTEESNLFKAYFKQVREELGLRLLAVLFNEDGKKNKFWQAFSKRKFMGKELRD